MRKNILFIRVDSSTKIGYGHFIRCMALAYTLKKNFEIIFRKYCIQSYKKRGKIIYVEKIEEQKIVKKKFKRWSISWNGLVGIDKQKFIESLLIETSPDNNFYNINLFGDLLFNIKNLFFC